jgi:uncharacterized membrane protein YhaH (DUF805 family)
VSTINPYVPPQAELESPHSGGFQVVSYWSATGRIGRLRYLAYSTGGYLILIAVSFVLGAIAGFVGKASIAGVVGVLAAIPYMVFAVMLGIRRAHDMDWSGWTVLLALIPLVGLIWLFKGGTPGENRFGLPPPPNTLGVKILAWIFPALMVIGIVAAIALPAYMQYSQRARAAQVQ